MRNKYKWAIGLFKGGTVKLDNIVMDAGTQARHAINDDTVTAYAERMEAGDKFPPVVVFHDGTTHEQDERTTPKPE
ncbi:MAG: hypothetical protein ACYTEQ_30535 [Planctomycetota bacterium]|jgi:hypothetical protein